MSKTPKSSVRFHMAKFITSNHIIGRLLYDGAPYSSKGIQKLKIQSPHLLIG